MNKHFARLGALISFSLASNVAAESAIITPVDGEVSPDGLIASDLNLSVSYVLAGHRSHSSHASHASHRSSSSRAYRTPVAPVPSPIPSYNTPSSHPAYGAPSIPTSRNGLPSQQPRPENSYSSRKQKSTKDIDKRKNVIMRVQLTLQYGGYYDGPVDGVMGPSTRNAIKRYKNSVGLHGDSVLDARTLNFLGIKGF